MKPTGIIFPNQLFEDNILILNCSTIYLVEEYLFFRQYKFHKAKIAFHRASMKFYESYLNEKGVKVVYIESLNELSDIRKLLLFLKQSGTEELQYIDTTDNWLERRITENCKSNSISAVKHRNLLFLNTPEENAGFFAGRRTFFQTDFYKHQRTSKNILIEKDGKPIGGKWTFDAENRMRYPKDKIPPVVSFPKMNEFYKEALEYTHKNFPENYGELNPTFLYPTTFEESKLWFHQFLITRFNEFGIYEDAIVAGENILNHSVLAPMLNIGLITPQFIVDETLKFAAENQIPLNSLEGFIRQIVGWREFIRAVYELKGSEERTRNFWGFNRKIPPSFWNGTTGIEPVDAVIRKVLKTGYCHHIERLMVLGNFMLLCEFDPDEVYRWFMEMFIDASDWVMVPNVYGMTQFADGGLMATKPYISGSNYLMKMSDFKKGPWQVVWDGLFWRFMHVHREFFLQNPRLGMLVKSFDKMPEQKQKMHLMNAENFLFPL
jgi:deoxyribodipyrimidine photolyase-related protein